MPTKELNEATQNKNSDLIDSDIANLSKSDAVAMLVKQAKNLVEKADTKLNDCQATLRSNLQEYESAKAQLKEVFEEYIGTLVTSSRIKPHLDKTIIEGHTDSDGGYLYNLNLSLNGFFWAVFSIEYS